jgi:beta-lactamase class A
MKIIGALLTLLLLPVTIMQAAEESTFAARDERVQKIVDEAAAATLKEFAAKKLQSNQLAVTLVDLRDAKHLKLGSFRGGEKIYPASVIKLFYLAAAHQWMQNGKLKDTEELRRALRDMIVDSSNDATHYVLDALTDTTSGLELPDSEMKAWGEKRDAVNRYFTSLGYTNINANQKPWNDGPYGRDRIWLGKTFGNRNGLTTDATARLCTEIALRRFVSGSRCEQMLEILKRDPANKKDEQARFSFSELPAGAKLFSKAGWTSTTRHDAAYVEMPDGRKFVLVTFTTQQANNRDIVPYVAQRVLEKL